MKAELTRTRGGMLAIRLAERHESSCVTSAASVDQRMWQWVVCSQFPHSILML